MTKITLEDLAFEMRKGFAEAEKKTAKGFAEAEKKTAKGFAEADKKTAKGFAEAEKKTDCKIDNLTTMIQKEFNRIDDRFNEMRGEIGLLRSEMNSQFSSVRADILRLNEDICEIKKELKIERKRTIEDVDILTSKVLRAEDEIKLLKIKIKNLKAA